MTSKEKKAKYMKKYLDRRKANGGKCLGTIYARRATDISKSDFNKRFMVKDDD